MYKLLFSICCLLFSAALTAQPEAEAALAEQYFIDKEYDSALELYEKLYKKETKDLYVMRIMSCYEGNRKFADAILFMDKAIKKQPDKVIYPVMKAALMEKNGDIEPAELLYQEIMTKKLRQESDFAQTGSYLYKLGKLEMAEAFYLEGRRKLKNDELFADELAAIYDVQGLAGKATREYLKEYYFHRESYENMSLAIINMTGNGKKSDTEIETVLLEETDKSPGDLGIRQILFEYYVLIKNFQEAFIQVKSIDKFFGEAGERVFKFAETLRNNKQYELSNKAYNYIIENKEGTPYYKNAFLEKAVTGEIKAFEAVPVDVVAIQEAVKSYGELINQFGKEGYFDAIYRRANLQVFFLNELDEPLKELREVTKETSNLRTQQRDNWAKAKLLIADILVMQKDYNNAKLIYTELAEAFKDRQTGALAKFRLAQMAYYRGEFEMSQGLLSAIKDNTSNDISNDAIQLSLKIIDNTGLDSTTNALAMFAAAELLVYQRLYEPAMRVMDSLAYMYPTHSLTDEIYWAKANIYLKKNEIPKALELLDKILEKNKEDIYGDDALYTKARLYDYNMKDTETALKYYLEFLTAYPGSLFSVEVRKRIRMLRKEG